jgi:hypothetical protein
MNVPLTFKRAVVVMAWVAIALLAILMGYDLWRSGVDDGAWGLPLAGILFNTVLRTIPMILLLVALGLIVEVLSEEAQQGMIQPRVRRWLYWLPRVSVLLFTALVSLFSLDVFGMGYGFWETMGAFLIHSIPTLFMIAVIVIAWRWEWIGGVLFIAWALFYVVNTQGFGAGVYLMMAALPFALGVLFLLNWHFRRELHASH